VRVPQATRDVLFSGLGRDAEAVRNLLVGTSVKYAQGKCGTALRRQLIDCLLYEPIPFVSQELGLRRLALVLSPGIIEIP